MLAFYTNATLFYFVAECSLIVAHEFFDALPIYKFERTEEGWRELVVDLEEDEASTYHFRFVLAPGPTQASRAFAEHPAYEHFKPGERIEISPDSFRVAHEMAKHMNANGGSALIVDYGKDYIQGDTLRVRSFLYCYFLRQIGLVASKTNNIFCLCRVFTSTSSRMSLLSPARLI